MKLISYKYINYTNNIYTIKKSVNLKLIIGLQDIISKASAIMKFFYRCIAELFLKLNFKLISRFLGGWMDNSTYGLTK